MVQDNNLKNKKHHMQINTIKKCGSTVASKHDESHDRGRVS
jgi:hypothetical protein